MIRSIILFVALIASAPASAGNGRNAMLLWNDAVEDYVATFDSEAGVGSSVVLLRNGRVIASKHIGMADIAQKRAVDDDTIYHWASITKTFTGIALMQLRDRGLVSLDDPVTQYLPELRTVHNRFGSMDAITLRQLMSHSAGFRTSTWPWGGEKDWHPHEPKSWSQLVAMFPYTEIEYAPGSRYSYSNLGLTIVGRIVETVSGDDIEVYVDKNILKPLGMTRSYFDLTPWHLRKFRANNYRVTNGARQDMGPELDTGVTNGNGGLNGPISDMVRYVAFLTGSGNREVDDDILKRSTLEEMWRPQLPAESLDEPGITKSVGLAFFIYDAIPDGGGPMARYINHSGNQAAYRSFIFLDPVSKAAAIMAANSSVEENRSAQKLRNALLKRIFPAMR